MSSIQESSNSKDIISSTGAILSTTNKRIDIYAKLKEILLKHKEILATAVIVAGIIISALGYIYFQGYYSYFGVSTKWISTQNSSFFFQLILPISAAVILMFPNLIAAFPLLAKTNVIKTITFEFSWILNLALILFCIYYQINFTNFPHIIVGLFLVPLYMSFLSDSLRKGYDIVTGVVLFFVTISFLIWIVYKSNENEIVLKWENIVALILVTILITGLSLIIWLMIKIDKHSNPPSQNTPKDKISPDKIIKNSNITVIAIVITMLIFSAITACMLYFSGASDASQKNVFNIIKLNNVEYSDTVSPSVFSNKDIMEFENEIRSGCKDSVVEKIKDRPFLQIVELKDEKTQKLYYSVRRVINSYVIVAENDEKYLVVNAYIDESNNMFLFTEEKREIEKTGQLINTVKFKKVLK